MGHGDKSILIHSKILDEMICLTEIPIIGRVCYSEKEIKFLRACEKNMKPERYADYLRKIHLVKKTLPGSKIEDIKMEARQATDTADLRVEDAEQPVASTTECTHKKPTARCVGGKDENGTVPTEIYCEDCGEVLVPWRGEQPVVATISEQKPEEVIPGLDPPKEKSLWEL